MADLSWLSQEAHTIHTYFNSLFYVMALSFLTIGVFLEYFQWPLGGTPSFAPLVGRVLVAAVLISAYPEISNLIADIADAVSQRLGDLNQISLVEHRFAEKWAQQSWNWVSIKDTVTMAISYVCFYLLYFSVFVTDAFFLYTWTLLYVFSPILIALFILPVTAGATSALFRSLIEVACWKIVWSVLATLLWSAALTDINKPGADIPFLTVICFDLILAGSVLLTPFIVNALAGKGLTSATRSIGSIAIGSLALSPLSAAKKAKGAFSSVKSVAGRTGNSFMDGYRGTSKSGSSGLQGSSKDTAPKGTTNKIKSR
jgi:hypothetical protein